MAVTIANMQQNHRGIYFEVTGDGVTTALVVNHGLSIRPGDVLTATVVTAPVARVTEHTSGKGGFVYPTDGTPVAVSSVTFTAPKTAGGSGTLTVNTTAAVANGVKAYVAVVCSQESAQG